MPTPGSDSTFSKQTPGPMAGAGAGATRRAVLGTLAAAPLASVSLAAILADPKLAAAAAAELETVSLSLPGGGEVSGALALPKGDGPAPCIILIHEWWGLNDQIKSVARDFAEQGYVALAVDLYGGQVATAPEQAKELMGAVDAAAATATLVGWHGWLAAHPRASGKIGVIGWCFGGGWSLNASIAAPMDATVIYYGRVDRTADDLKSLKGPVLGQFAEQDQWINHDMVGQFEAAMAEAGKALTVHWYQANHAFANPTGARYDEANTKLAWERTVAFLAENLK